MSALDSQTHELAMSREASDMTVDDFRCRLCGEVIGVYEPLVVCEGVAPRTTSRAAEPMLEPDETYYHRLCFAGRDGASGG